jgi:hypothetical protein
VKLVAVSSAPSIRVFRICRTTVVLEVITCGRREGFKVSEAPARSAPGVDSEGELTGDKRSG